MTLSHFFSISPSTTPGHSARVYVPVVVVSRGLAFLRFFFVARLLGNAGQREFGIYQPALELINWVLPLILFGLADVAERYAARFEKEHTLDAMFRRHVIRLVTTGLAVVIVMAACSPFIAVWLWGPRTAGRSVLHDVLMISTCGMAVFLLACDVYLAAILRGIRAFSAAAGMELVASCLFFVFSVIAAAFDGALGLLVAYALALLLPVVFYSSMLITHLRKTVTETVSGAGIDEDAAPNQIGEPGSIVDYQAVLSDDPARYRRFARWSLIRQLLTMSFAFIAIWAVGFLAASDPARETAAYAMPYRLAQLLAYVAITMWISCYGIAAKDWAHHQTRRAKVQFFRVGKFGAVVLALLAVGLLLGRGLVARVLPTDYSEPIAVMLPPSLAVFLLFSLQVFVGMFADLMEKPERSAAMWAGAVIVQVIAIFCLHGSVDTKLCVLMSSSAGLGFSLLILAPLLLWPRSGVWRLPATAIPVILIALAAMSLFLPTWSVDVIVPIVMFYMIGILVVSGLLIRPVDRRDFQRFRHRSR